MGFSLAVLLLFSHEFFVLSGLECLKLFQFLLGGQVLAELGNLARFVNVLLCGQFFVWGNDGWHLQLLTPVDPFRQTCGLVLIRNVLVAAALSHCLELVVVLGEVVLD